MYDYHLSSWEAEASRSLYSRPAWFTELVPGQPELKPYLKKQKTNKAIATKERKNELKERERDR